MRLNNEERKRIVLKLLIITVILLLITGIFLFLYYKSGLNEEFRDVESLKVYILSFGNNSKLFYILLHYIQSTIIPISNIPTIMAGVFIYGPFEASILSIIGILLGSVTAFMFGKIFGKKAVYWVVGKTTVERYLKLSKGKEKYVIFLILLFPGFPDDVICFIAGITNMRWRFFLVSILITRTIPIFLTAYIGNIIPYTLWGLLIWVAIFIAFIIVGTYILKNWNHIDYYIDKVDQRFNKKDDNHN